MFSKVFRVEKRSRELVASQRPTSTTYYPLSASCLPEHGKRVSVQDPRLLERDLDLLELVCRSDSLHRRLDELQAKYERVDDGMANLTRASYVKKNGNSGIFCSLRTSKSFEEQEKKPGFFRRLFGNRLSRSEDDLLDAGGTPNGGASSDRFSRSQDDLLGSQASIPDACDEEETREVPRRKERRSASEDILETKNLLRRTTQKRPSWGADGGDLRQAMPPPPPPPPPPPLPQFLRPPDAAGRKCGLKRKRVIRVYNLDSLDSSSRESFGDWTDCEARSTTATAAWSNPPGSTGPRADPRRGGGTRRDPEVPCDHATRGVASQRPLGPQGSPEGPPGLRLNPIGAVATASEGDRLGEAVAGKRGKVPPAIGVRRQGGIDVDETDSTEGEADVVADGRDVRPAGETLRIDVPGTVETQSLTSPKVENPAKPNPASPRVETRIKPILKNAGRSLESDVTEGANACGSSLTRRESSIEVLLPRARNLRERRPPETAAGSLDLPLSKTTSCQELSVSRTPGHQELSLYRPPSSQELPSKASIQELDHFLSAIIKNLETQLQSGGNLALKPRVETAETKRKRKKRKENGEEEQKMGDGVVPRRYRRMSECGACGRRWLEPRLLPCLHTVCTPCLHARAAHITPTPGPNPAHTGGSGKITPTPAATPESRRASQDQVSLRGNLGPVSDRDATASTAVLAATAASPTPAALSTPSSSRQLNGEGSSSSTMASHSSLSSCNGSRDGSSSTSHSAQHPRVNEGQEALPQENQQNQSSPQQVTASADLESVIELLTNLSPNNNRAPRVTVTPTPIIDESLTKSTPVIPSEDDVLSPSGTLDSRCSSRTRSSGRSSSCESIQKNRGVWVVWCPECGYEAEVPSGGVECFPLNYVLQKQLVLEALNSSTTTVYCDLCHDDVVAEERCDTCPVNLCRLCSHAHTRQRRTAHHTVISLQEARTRGIREVAHTLVCATHGEGEVGWWCRECHEPLCAACLATLHRGHSAITVDQEAPQARRNLTALFDQASSRMNELLSTVEDLTGAATRVQQRGRVVSDQVNAFIDDYIMALEEHRHTLLRQVRQACERAQRGIVTESQRAGQTASWLRQGCDLTHDLLHHAGDAEVLALAHLVSCRLKSLLSEQVKSWTRWERLALLREHRAAKVRGHRIHGVIADTPADPANSRLKPLCDITNLVVGTRATALVVARDVDGQPITHGGEEISATVLTRDGTTLCGCSVRDREDGSYEVIFSPPVPAAAALHITIQSAHIQGSPLEITITSAPSGICNVASEDNNKEAISGRRHTGVFHCCTFCSSGGDKTATCACAATMPGGYQGCGHNHNGHPGQKHWSCCAQTNPSAPCTRPPSQYYQVTL